MEHLVPHYHFVVLIFPGNHDPARGALSYPLPDLEPVAGGEGLNSWNHIEFEGCEAPGSATALLRLRVPLEIGGGCGHEQGAGGQGILVGGE